MNYVSKRKCLTRQTAKVLHLHKFRIFYYLINVTGVLTQRFVPCVTKIKRWRHTSAACRAAARAGGREWRGVHVNKCLCHTKFRVQLPIFLPSSLLRPSLVHTIQQLSRVATGVWGGTTVHYRPKETRLLHAVRRHTWLLLLLLPLLLLLQGCTRWGDTSMSLLTPSRCFPS